MKTLILGLFLALSSLLYGQDIKPTNIEFYRLQTPNNITFWYNPIDSSLWAYKGESGWVKIANARDLAKYKLKKDSINLSGYFTQFDALLKEDKVNKENTTLDYSTIKYPTLNLVHNRLDEKQNLNTGFITGLNLSINADPTKYDLSAGWYTITDYTDIVKPIVTLRYYAGATGLTPFYLTSLNVTYIALDINGNILSSGSPFTNADRRTKIIVGALIHSNHSTINLTNELKAPIVAGTNQLHDFMRAIGSINVTGNVYSESGANLNMNKTAGLVFGLGINADDYTNPHELTIGQQTALTFRYRIRTGLEYANTVNIDPDHWDNAGVLTVTNNNKFTIQHINLFQSGATRIQYGQHEYLNVDDAMVYVNTETFTTEQNIAENAIFRCYLIIKQGITNLVTGVAAGDVHFIPVDKFGNVIGGASAALTYDAIIATLGYTPENVVNKVTTISGSSTDLMYPSAKLLYDQLALRPNQTLANTSDATSHTVTLSNSGGSTKLVEGTGIGLVTTGTGLDGIATITNSSPDQIVSISSGVGLEGTSGAYPSFGISLGTPSTVTSITTNSVSTTTHTHAITPSLGFIGNGTAQYQVPVTGISPFIPVWTAATISGVNLGSSLGTLTISSPLTGASYNGSSGVSIGIPVAATGSNGYLTSTDWNTFNSKQPAGSYLVAADITGKKDVSDSTVITGYTRRDRLASQISTRAPKFVSGTANYFWATPNGSAGLPSLRAIVVADIPTLNQATTGQAGSVANSNIIKFDTGITEGTDIYTYNGSAAKTVDIKAGTNVTLTKAAGSVTINSSNPGGTVTSVVALTLGTAGTDLSSTVVTGTTTPVITLNVPTASGTNRGALSSTDWTNFNTAYTNRITSLTTTGSSGAATLATNVLNVPNYTLAGLGGAPSSGSANYIQNQNTSAQTANMWINGSVRAATAGESFRVSTATTDPYSLALTNAGGSVYFGKEGSTAGGYFTGSNAYESVIYGTNSLFVNQSIRSIGTIQATTAKLTNLTDGYIPYHISDAAGLGNSPVFTDGTNVGIGTTSPTARLHLAAGTATASTAPLKFTSGTLMATAENGAFEYDGSHFYGSIGTTRYQLDNPDSHVSGSDNQSLSNTSTATDHTVTLSSTGGSVTLKEGVGISLSTTGTTADGIVTINNAAGTFVNSYGNKLAITATTTSINWPQAFDNANYFLNYKVYYNETISGKSVQVANGVYNSTKTVTGFSFSVDSIAGWVEYFAADTINLAPMSFANYVAKTDVVTAIGAPGSDLLIPSEKAVRTEITTIKGNTGILKSNGTTISSATAGTDYSSGTSSLSTGLVKSTTSTGALSIGVSGTDYSAGTSSLATGIVKSTTSTGALSIAANSDLPVMSATVGGAVPTPPNNTTTFLRGDGTFSDQYVARLVLASDKPTGANTTPVTTGLSFNYEANSTYIADIYGIVSAATTTTGFSIQIDVSTAVTYVALQGSNQRTSTGLGNSWSSVGDAGVTSITSTSDALDTNSNLTSGKGLLITTTNAGTATFMFSSETTAVTTLKAGTVILIRKI